MIVDALVPVTSLEVTITFSSTTVQVFGSQTITETIIGNRTISFTRKMVSEVSARKRHCDGVSEDDLEEGEFMLISGCLAPFCKHGYQMLLKSLPDPSNSGNIHRSVVDTVHPENNEETDTPFPIEFTVYAFVDGTKAVAVNTSISDEEDYFTNPFSNWWVETISNPPGNEPASVNISVIETGNADPDNPRNGEQTVTFSGGHDFWFGGIVGLVLPSGINYLVDPPEPIPSTILVLALNGPFDSNLGSETATSYFFCDLEGNIIGDDPDLLQITLEGKNGIRIGFIGAYGKQPLEAITLQPEGVLGEVVFTEPVATYVARFAKPSRILASISYFDFPLSGLSGLVFAEAMEISNPAANLNFSGSRDSGIGEVDYHYTITGASS